jgi:hypothetical protein
MQISQICSVRVKFWFVERRERGRGRERERVGEERGKGVEKREGGRVGSKNPDGGAP